MKVLEESTPSGVIVQNGVSETEDLIGSLGNHREVTVLGWRQSPSPHLLAIGEDVSIEVSVQVGTSIVTSPTVGVKIGDGVCVVLGGIAILHDQSWIRHGGLLIDPGIGTVQSRLPDRHGARSLRSLWMNQSRLSGTTRRARRVSIRLRPLPLFWGTLTRPVPAADGDQQAA